ncbi:hypothetical protein ACWGNE_28775 [Streptomyces xiamenensis]
MGGTMTARGAACAALLALAALTTGCSSGSSDDKPQPTVTATKTVDQAAARKACVTAWADLIKDSPDAGMDEEPSPCQGLPEGDRIDRYMEGLQQLNRANRDELQDCLDDPTCTEAPAP